MPGIGTVFVFGGRVGNRRWYRFVSRETAPEAFIVNAASRHSTYSGGDRKPSPNLFDKPVLELHEHLTKEHTIGDDNRVQDMRHSQEYCKV